jgi:hypothetical protein
VIIRECDLDAPIEARERRSLFRHETRCTTALYERLLGRVSAPNIWKILVECVPDVHQTEPRNLLGVAVIQAAFDINTFFASSPDEKKRLSLETIHRGALSLAAFYQWDPEPFRQAHAAALQKKIVNDWSREKSSPGRRYIACLSCLHDISTFRAWLSVRTRAGTELAHVPVIETRPSEFAFAQALGKLVWTSETRVALLDRSEKEVCHLTIE